MKMTKKIAAQSWAAIQRKATCRRLGPLAKTARPDRPSWGAASSGGLVDKM
jgi:hypothetical protein